MSIRKNPIALNNKPRAHAGRNLTRTPRRFVVWLLGCRLYSNEAFSDLGRLKADSKENTEEKKWHP
jgi:hypothetical protein